MTSIPFEICRISSNNFNCIISKTKDFSAIFIAFLKPASNLQPFEKKVSLLVSVFPKLLTQKEVVTWMSKTTRSRTPFRNQRVHEFQTLSKEARNHHYPIVPWIWDKLSWKKCRLVKFKILRLFVNTLTADDKYSRRCMKKFPQQIQTALSLKQKTFFWNFYCLSEFYREFKRLWRIKWVF